MSLRNSLSSEVVGDAGVVSFGTYVLRFTENGVSALVTGAQHADQRLHVDVEVHRRLGLRAHVRHVEQRAAQQRAEQHVRIHLLRDAADGARRVDVGRGHVRAERLLGELRGAVPLVPSGPLLKYFTVPAVSSASRVSVAEVAAVGVEAGSQRLQQQARDRGRARIRHGVADAERADHALLGVVEAIGTRGIDDLAEELRDVHALVVVVAVAVVADGDGVRIAAGAHAPDDFVVGEAHDRHVARGVAGDERVGAVRRDRDAARLDADVDRPRRSRPAWSR